MKKNINNWKIARQTDDYLPFNLTVKQMKSARSLLNSDSTAYSDNHHDQTTFFQRKYKESFWLLRIEFDKICSEEASDDLPSLFRDLILLPVCSARNIRIKRLVVGMRLLSEYAARVTKASESFFCVALKFWISGLFRFMIPLILDAAYSSGK